jgi:hypothetical protein
MFSMDDIDKADNNSKKIPSGLMDNTDFVNNMHTVYNVIKNTDFFDERSRIRFSLHLINSFMDEKGDIDKDSCLNTIINLCSHIQILFQIIGEDTEEYFENYKTSLLDKFDKHTKDEPYYE